LTHAKKHEEDLRILRERIAELEKKNANQLWLDDLAEWNRFQKS